MKKSLWVLAPLMVVSLASCGGAGKTLNELKGSSVMSKEVLMRNYALDSHKMVSFDAITRIGEQELKESSIVGYSTNLGLSVLKNNTTNELSLYSMFANKLVVKMAADSSYEFRSVGTPFGADFAIVKNSEGKFAVYSDRGDMVYSSDNELAFAEYSFDYENLICNLVIIDDAKPVVLYYAVGNVEAHKYAINENVPAKLAKMKLDSRGLKGYVMYQDDLHIRVEKDGKKVAEYDQPYYSANFSGGKYDYFFHEYELPDTIEDYDFIRSGIKYACSIERIDVTNGQKKSIKLDGYYPYMSSPEILLDKDGNQSYVVANVYALTKDKVIDTASSARYILDADLKLHDSMDRFMSPYAFEFNSKTYVVDIDDNYKLYDEKLNLIGKYDIADNFVKGANVFIAEQGYKYGIINVEGKVVVPFVYDRIDGVYSNGTAYGVLDAKEQKITYSATNADAYKTEDFVAPIDKAFLANEEMLEMEVSTFEDKVVFSNLRSGEMVKEFANAKDWSIVSSNPLMDLKNAKISFLGQITLTDDSKEYYAVSYSMTEEMMNSLPF